jgi:6-phosphofructokinase 1
MRRTAGSCIWEAPFSDNKQGPFHCECGRRKEGNRARRGDRRDEENFDALGISGLIIVGGDGSLTASVQLHEAGIPFVGVPKAIENDLEATAMSFGFDSAVACVAGPLIVCTPPATSHRRVMVIEVTGRRAGWIALYGGLAGGADIILIPEIPFDYERVAAAVRQRELDGCLSTLVVVAEGATERGAKLSEQHGAELAASGSGRPSLRRFHSARARRRARVSLGSFNVVALRPRSIGSWARALASMQ